MVLTTNILASTLRNSKIWENRTTREMADKLMKVVSKHAIDKCRISGEEFFRYVHLLN